MLKKLLIGLLVLIVVVVVVVKLAVFKIQGEPVAEGDTEIAFTKTDIGFTHSLDLDAELPFMGVTAVDIDGDDVDEIFFGNGTTEPDGLYRYADDGFQKLSSEEAGLGKPSEVTYGAASIDTDGDGAEELFVCRKSGVYFYKNNGSGQFTQTLIDFGMDEGTTPLSVALGDINRDGKVDLYVSGYIRIDLVEGETNFDSTYGGWSYLLLNRGDDTWENISESSGVGRKHNTFLAIFVDLDNDRWPDLTVAQDTGKVETWRNNGDNTFSPIENGTVFSYPMGIAAGDLDNDGDVDLYYSNVGTTLPEAMLRGNLAKDDPFNMDYMLLRNDGGTGFTDVAVEKNAAKYGFGWGSVSADFDNDGRMDLYFAQNYARFPGVKFLELYPGRLLQQQNDGAFLSVEKAAGIAQDTFGITQVVSDFNRDGWPDMVLGNLNGKAQSCINGGGSNHWLTVDLPSTPEWLNTRVEVTAGDGSVLTRQLFASEGLCSDQGDDLFFGLGQNTEISQVKIMPISGEDRVIDSPQIDSILTVQ